MKHSLLIAASLFLSTAIASAEECKVPTQKHSKELEKMKSLAGRWEGTTAEGGKENKAVVFYEITSGGTAVVETLFPGTEHEMVSVYHDEKGKLAMTHYCMLGNQPNLTLKSSSPTEIDLDFAKNNTINPKTEDHMHSLRLVFIDEDTMVQNWSGYQNRELKAPTVMKFSRVK